MGEATARIAAGPGSYSRVEGKQYVTIDGWEAAGLSDVYDSPVRSGLS